MRVRQAPFRKIRFHSPTTADLRDVVRFPNDFTYLGAMSIQRDYLNGQTFYGRGLTVVRENSDGTNPLHFVLLNGTPNHYCPYEIRAATFSTGSGNQYDPGTYNQSTILKSYGTTVTTDYDFATKRTVIYGGVEVNFGNDLDGSVGVMWDSTDSRLYFNWGFGYSDGTMANAKSILYATRNYAGDALTPTGPWRISGQGWKSTMNGFCRIPSSYATTYLSGKRIGVGCGGYFSVQSQDDCSMGFSLTAVDPISASEGTAITGTPLVGYWPVSGSPGAGVGRMLRAEAAYANQVDGWGNDYHNWNDRVQGAVWINTTNKRGVIVVGETGRGTTTYITSDMFSTFFGHWVATYDPMNFTPVSGTPRYEVQPTYNALVQYPVVDYSAATYTDPVPSQKSITSITTVDGAASSNAANSSVSCTSHGLSVGVDTYVEIRGSNNSSHNAIWIANASDANTFTLRNPQGNNWASGTSGANAKLLYGGINGDAADQVVGIDFDESANILYVALRRNYGVNGLQSKMLILAYQLNNP